LNGDLVTVYDGSLNLQTSAYWVVVGLMSPRQYLFKALADDLNRVGFDFLWLQDQQRQFRHLKILAITMNYLDSFILPCKVKSSILVSCGYDTFRTASCNKLKSELKSQRQTIMVMELSLKQTLPELWSKWADAHFLADEKYTSIEKATRYRLTQTNGTLSFFGNTLAATSASDDI